MLRAIALLLLTFALTGVRAASAQESPREELPLTVGIHDYAHVPGGALSHATRIVTRVYEQIGVRTNWLGTVRPDERKAGSANRNETTAGQIAQMTIIMLTPKMAARGRCSSHNPVSRRWTPPFRSSPRSRGRTAVS